MSAMMEKLDPEVMAERFKPLSVADRIATLRALGDMSQGDLARQLGVSRSTVGNWESDGSRCYPSRANRGKLSLLFGFPPGFFAEDEL
jgi:transcriptional regulator with XRE-family HTH domain